MFTREDGRQTIESLPIGTQVMWGSFPVHISGHPSEGLVNLVLQTGSNALDVPITQLRPMPSTRENLPA